MKFEGPGNGNGGEKNNEQNKDNLLNNPPRPENNSKKTEFTNKEIEIPTKETPKEEQIIELSDADIEYVDDPQKSENNEPPSLEELKKMTLASQEDQENSLENLKDELEINLLKKDVYEMNKAYQENNTNLNFPQAEITVPSPDTTSKKENNVDLEDEEYEFIDPDEVMLIEDDEIPQKAEDDVIQLDDKDIEIVDDEETVKKAEEDIAKKANTKDEVIELSDSDIIEVQEDPEAINFEVLTFPDKKERVETNLFRAEAHLSSMKHNEAECEDTYVLNQEANITVIADAMGGVEGGVYARQKIQEIFSNFKLDANFDQLSFNEKQDYLFNQFLKLSNTIEKGKTTLSFMHVFEQDNKKKAIIANFGDSGIYKLNKDGKLEELIKLDGFWESFELLKNIDKLNALDQIFLTKANGDERITQILSAPLQVYLSEKIEKDPQFKELVNNFDYHKLIQLIENDPDLQENEKTLFINKIRYYNKTSLSAFSPEFIDKDHIKEIELEEGDILFMASDGVLDNVPKKDLETFLQEPDKTANKIYEAINNNQDSNWFKADDISFILTQIK